MSEPPVDQGMRLDVWLWVARFFRTRALAKEAIRLSRVRIDGQPCKPARRVRVGDGCRIERAGETWDVTVRKLSDTRGPARVAQELYEESEASRLQREEQRAWRAAERAGFHPPEHRPDKRARRLLRALGDLDAM